MFIAMIAFWAFLIFGTAYLVRFIADSSGNRPGTVYTDASSLDILKRRYAKGEISKEQLEAMKRELA
jgi:putative membrane protein